MLYEYHNRERLFLYAGDGLSIVKVYCLEDRSSNPARTIDSFIVTPPHHCWGPPSLCLDGHWESFPEVKLYVIEINLLTLAVSLRTTRFNIQQFYVLPTQCVYVFFYGSQNRERVCFIHH